MYVNEGKHFAVTFRGIITNVETDAFVSTVSTVFRDSRKKNIRSSKRFLSLLSSKIPLVK